VSVHAHVALVDTITITQRRPSQYEAVRRKPDVPMPQSRHAGLSLIAAVSGSLARLAADGFNKFSDSPLYGSRLTTEPAAHEIDF
jgi:hypothetical protein